MVWLGGSCPRLFSWDELEIPSASDFEGLLAWVLQRTPPRWDPGWTFAHSVTLHCGFLVLVPKGSRAGSLVPCVVLLGWWTL